MEKYVDSQHQMKITKELTIKLKLFTPSEQFQNPI